MQENNNNNTQAEIEYVPVDEEREQVTAVIELLLKQLERAGVISPGSTIHYEQGER